MTGIAFTPAPIVVFGYNRPSHLHRTLEALSQADGAAEAELWIFCDGARPGAEAAVKAVRAVAHDPIWRTSFAGVEIVEADRNRGLARSIIGGVSQVIVRTGRVIVVEDDLIVSRDFLTFMNDCLNFFESDPTIGTVTGFSPLQEVPQDYAHDVMVVPRNSSHGWGTWADRWATIDWDAMGAVEAFQSRELRRRFNSAGSDRLDRLRRQLAGRIDSWSIRLGFHQLMHGQACVYPVQNRLINIGFDGSGVHCGVGVATNDRMAASGAAYRLSSPGIDRRIVREFGRIYSGNFAGRLARWLRVAAWLRNSH